jgi:hypothetical protein
MLFFMCWHMMGGADWNRFCRQKLNFDARGCASTCVVDDVVVNDLHFAPST